MVEGALEEVVDAALFVKDFIRVNADVAVKTLQAMIPIYGDIKIHRAINETVSKEDSVPFKMMWRMAELCCYGAKYIPLIQYALSKSSE